MVFLVYHYCLLRPLSFRQEQLCQPRGLKQLVALIFNFLFFSMDPFPTAGTVEILFSMT